MDQVIPMRSAAYELTIPPRLLEARNKAARMVDQALAGHGGAAVTRVYIERAIRVGSRELSGPARSRYRVQMMGHAARLDRALQGDV